MRLPIAREVGFPGGQQFRLAAAVRRSATLVQGLAKELQACDRGLSCCSVIEYK